MADPDLDEIRTRLGHWIRIQKLESDGIPNRIPESTKDTGKQLNWFIILAVLWNRNYLLRFRFRLLKSYGSGSGSNF